ncbi:unnamed protein product [Schistosoma rodhaini]|uniref:Nas2 N-terminal domain-containing protein n=1 Tax=Schistosoma rodhaini TaxID=6188 RepID=A0AA85FVJ6_9TREM|nr:unnamed protein product [Schistosoma rodhaini]
MLKKNVGTISLNRLRAVDTDSDNFHSIKSKYDGLVDEKNRIEKKLSELSEILRQNGNVGLDTPLVDDEGYPRPDIDVALIRITRNNIRCLNTDHKQIMLELESVLHKIHEYARQNPSKNVLTDGNACSSENKLIEDQSAQIVKKAFLKIDQISPNSIVEQAVSIYYLFK